METIQQIEKPQFASAADWPGFSMTFKNGWEISVQFGSSHYCSNRDNNNSRRRSGTAEVAIFSPNGAWWSYDEKLDNVVKPPIDNPTDSFVNGWLTTDQVASIINIISNKNETK